MSLIAYLIHYIESANYLVIALIVLLIYIVIREGIKRAAEKHGYIAVAVLGLIFGLMVYLRLFLYAVLVFLLLALLTYFSVRGDMIRAAREEKHNIQIERAREKVRTKANMKASKKGAKSK